MKRRFLAALSALLAGHGLAFAQQVGSNPDPIVREPLSVGDRSDKAPACGSEYAQDPQNS